MKKSFILIFVSCLILGSSPSDVDASNGFLEASSKLYFLRSWGETIRLYFTFSPEQKVEYLLKLTDRRLEEISANYPADNQKTSERYLQHFRQMEKLALASPDNIQVSSQIRERNLAQQRVLGILAQSASPELKQTLLNTQENSAQNVGRIVEKIEGPAQAQEYREQVRQIQQMQLIEQVPLESDGPAADPSQNVPQSLRDLNPSKASQEQNPLNELKPAQNNEGQNSGATQNPNAPAPQESPLPKN